jgi:plasmid maintenance system killer protein
MPRPRRRDGVARNAVSSMHGNRYSVWVDENYRVTFRFDRGHAYEVAYEDYR